MTTVWQKEPPTDAGMWLRINPTLLGKGSEVPIEVMRVHGEMDRSLTVQIDGQFVDVETLSGFWWFEIPRPELPV